MCNLYMCVYVGTEKGMLRCWKLSCSKDIAIVNLHILLILLVVTDPTEMIANLHWLHSLLPCPAADVSFT